MGWHWTMNHFYPEQTKWDDLRKIVSHDYPLIGDGFDHGKMPESAFPLLLKWVDEKSISGTLK